MEREDERHGNWPVVYVLDDGNTQAHTNRPRDIYVGESLNLAKRLRDLSMWTSKLPATMLDANVGCYVVQLAGLVLGPFG